MKSRIAFLAVVLTFGAAAFAAAQDGAAYQNALLARPLSPADKAICDAKAGANNPAAYSACRVTRLFLADINANRDQGIPSMTDVKYVTQAEMAIMVDRMSKSGG